MNIIAAIITSSKIDRGKSPRSPRRRNSRPQTSPFDPLGYYGAGEIRIANTALISGPVKRRLIRLGLGDHTHPSKTPTTKLTCRLHSVKDVGNTLKMKHLHAPVPIL